MEKTNDLSRSSIVLGQNSALTAVIEMTLLNWLVGPLDRAAGECHGVDDVPQGMTVVRVIWHRLGVESQQPLGSRRGGCRG